MASILAADGRRPTRKDNAAEDIRSPKADDDKRKVKVEIKTEPSAEDEDSFVRAEGNKSSGDSLRKKRNIRRRGTLSVARKQWPRRRLTRATVAAAKSKRGGRGEPPNVALDMLAEVASATLKSDPTIKIRSPTGKGNVKLLSPAQKKVQLSAEHLTLDQIRSLSDKNLVTTFAELTADEIRRNYSYRCYLLPDKCQQRYSSFGNENKARLHMKNHLLGHVNELLMEAGKLGKSVKSKFVAETVASRKRKQEVKQQALARRTKVVRRNLAAPTVTSTAGVSGKQQRFTRMRPTILLAVKQRETTNKSALLRVRIPAKSFSHHLHTASPAAVSTESLGDTNEETLEEQSSLSPPEEVATQHIVIEAVDEAWKPGDMEMVEASSYVVEESASSADQPHHDHCYTSTEGRRATPEIYYWDGDQEDVANVDVQQEEEVYAVEDAVSFIPVEDAATPSQIPESSTSSFAPVVAEAQFQRHTPLLLRRPKASRLRAPKQDDAVAWKFLDEEVAQDPDTLMKESPEWERLTALQYIRQLRTKKKDQRAELTCRICKDKKFTAQATLMYHYRSHAGIKPFVCNICDTTFTRQHSLNYHMLIHNNKSRFTCKECGREFRHPSHFKEHLRRHTGETPFECADCGIRFKTRNTYKRHLKTRHGKLLTVNGIVDLSAEEFSRVRTKPKKTPRQEKTGEWPANVGLRIMAADEYEAEATVDEPENEYEMEDREAATVIASRDVGVDIMEDGGEEQGAENGAAQVFQVLSQAGDGQSHQLNDIVIRAYVINMEDGTTQLALCQQPRFGSATPVTLQAASLQRFGEQEASETYIEGEGQEEDDHLEHESILGLASEGQQEDGGEVDAAPVTWIDEDGNEVCYGNESVEDGTQLQLHAVVPCT